MTSIGNNYCPYPQAVAGVYPCYPTTIYIYIGRRGGENNAYATGNDEIR
jgi:hypothetical protein